MVLSDAASRGRPVGGGAEGTADRTMAGGMPRKRRSARSRRRAHTNPLQFRLCARRAVVTASVDSMTFLHPVHIGNLIVLRSSVNRVFTSSMEVGVRVEVENLRTGERRHTSSAYLTFVALEEGDGPVVVRPVIPE